MKSPGRGRQHKHQLFFVFSATAVVYQHGTQSSFFLNENHPLQVLVSDHGIFLVAS